ncbi:MerR family transcriptional regulator [Halomonas piscis]|uniref:MerR family transcriptional regulator n=1 Tax=Halomonas piscis TaxID=3031727 RepID=UPI002899D9F8|nr:MerR family transcriptional regulator [Halomonas piscis]
MSNKASHPPDTPLYPIREVSRLTGVNSVTLRAWERRYGLIKPQRTPKGHRLYAQADITRIEHILQWLNRGVSVSQVADLLNQPETVEAPAPASDDWDSQRRQLIAMVENLDTAGIEALYHQSLALYPLNLAINELWQPVVQTLEARWQETPDPLARHTLEALVRSQVGIRLHHANKATRGPLLLLGPAPGEPSPLWALFVALLASEHGYRVQLMDQPLPLESLPQAVSRLRISMALLAAGQPTEDAALNAQLAAAADGLDVPLGLCGSPLPADGEGTAGSLHLLGDDLPRAVSRLRPLLRESGML